MIEPNNTFDPRQFIMSYEVAVVVAETSKDDATPAKSFVIVARDTAQSRYASSPSTLNNYILCLLTFVADRFICTFKPWWCPRTSALPSTCHGPLSLLISLHFSSCLGSSSHLAPLKQRICLSSQLLSDPKSSLEGRHPSLLSCCNPIGF
jgi:hypothetical protein